MCCGGEEGKIDEEPFIVVESDIPGMYFEIPEGALPAGFDPADIKITPVPSPADSTPSKDGVERQAWKLTPDGARFEKPIRLIIPFEQSIPVIFHLYEDEIEWVSGVHYKMADGGNTASVPLDHFSVVVSAIPPEAASIFEISGVAADTLIEEPIDVQLVFRMTREYFEVPLGEPGTEDFEVFRTVVLPHGREACPPDQNSCIIYSFSDKFIYGETLLEPDPRNFGDEFTLHSDDFVCDAAGTGVIVVMVDISYLVHWSLCESGVCVAPENPEKLQPTGGSRHYISFFLEIPVNCVEDKFEVEVLGFDQRILTEMVSIEASSNTMHQRGHDEEYNFDLISGDGVLVTTSTQDYVQISQSSQKKPYHHISLRQEANIPPGLSALAAITTQTQNSALDFFVKGELRIDIDGMDGIDPKHWGADGLATAQWSMAVSIREPSVIKIENCELFDPLSFASFPEFQQEAGNCSFRITGSTSKFELPSAPGLPAMSYDPDSVQIDDDHEESKRLNALLRGQVVMFDLSVNHSERVSSSPSGTESVRNESFSIRIQPELRGDND
jgi:hypothetical protein